MEPPQTGQPVLEIGDRSGPCDKLAQNATFGPSLPELIAQNENYFLICAVFDINPNQWR
jgi:hypothetical protein